MGRPGALIQDENLSPGGPQFFFYGLTNLKVQLWELVGNWITDPQDWHWQPHEPIPGATGSTAIENISEAFKSWPPRFFVTSNGSLWEHQWSQEGQHWLWIHHNPMNKNYFYSISNFGNNNSVRSIHI